MNILKIINTHNTEVIRKYHDQLENNNKSSKKKAIIIIVKLKLIVL